MNSSHALPNQAIAEFTAIYEKMYDEKLTTQLATIHANDFLNLYFYLSHKRIGEGVCASR